MLDKEQAVPLYQQVVDHYARLIREGKLRPGDRMPQTRELAAAYKIGHKTAQQALAALAQMDLVERCSRRGTFVSKRVASGRIALVFDTNIVADENSQFFRLLYNELLRLGRARGWTVELCWPEDEANPAGLIPYLAESVNAGNWRAVIAYAADPTLRAWLENSCPAVYIPGGFEASRLQPERSDAFRGVKYLHELGFQRIGVIGHTGDKPEVEAFIRQAALLACQAEEDKLHLTFRLGQYQNETQGMQAAATLLDSPQHPQALLVLNDRACRGAIFALLKQGLKIPLDIALMSSTNRGSELLCPVVLTALETDPTLYARQLLEQVQARLDGQTPCPTPIESLLRPGRSCAESP